MPWLDLLVLSELCAYGRDIRHAEKREDPAEQAFCRFPLALPKSSLPQR
jgi:hypothetical protein